MEEFRQIEECIDKIDDFEEPLAVEVGLGVGADDIPSEGWPESFKPEIVKRLLSYMPDA